MLYGGNFSSCGSLIDVLCRQGSNVTIVEEEMEEAKVVMKLTRLTV